MTTGGHLRAGLRRTAAELRVRSSSSPSDGPRWVELDDYLLEGKVLRRLRIILRSKGCSHPTCTMCPFPNEGVERGRPITAESLVEQVRTSLASHPAVEMVAIYNDGSFFSDSEMPGEAPERICRLVAASGCRVLMVESLPQLVTEDRLKRAMGALGRTRLVVGFGLQSVSRVVREVCVNSPVTLDGFMHAHRLLGYFGQTTKAYLMLKPPFLLEREGINDTVRSVRWLYKNGIRDIAICPTRVVSGTIAAALFGNGLFTPPRLTSVVETLRRIRMTGCGARVSLFNVDSSDLQSIPPAGCPECHDRTLRGIRLYNTAPASVDLSALECRVCEREVSERSHPYASLSIEARVRSFLDRKVGTLAAEVARQ